jgi:ATP-dependent Clp protease ATP-binding subunit ClpA
MTPLQPFIIVFTLIGLGGALLAVYQRMPGALPWIFGVSTLAAVIRGFMVAQEDRALRAQTTVDHEGLRAMDFEAYGAWLKENVRGQDGVVDEVVKTIQRGLTLSQSGRTLGSFLLVGPTGTGKTFLSLMAAKALWPDREPVVLRMNQYKSPSDVEAILGSAAGGEGALSQAFSENPQRVVLLDEIDKCHPEVLHCLFDALDGGRCRDKATGRTLDFSGCVFFATCNAGVESLRALKNVEDKTYLTKARDALAREGGFDKSFLARFTEILLMDSLSPVHLAEIACLLIGKQWREQGIEVSYIAPELLAEIVKSNQEFGLYGARQLAHCVRRMTDGLIEEARRAGVRDAKLGLSAAGVPTLIGEISVRAKAAS